MRRVMDSHLPARRGGEAALLMLTRLTIPQGAENRRIDERRNHAIPQCACAASAQAIEEFLIPLVMAQCGVELWGASAAPSGKRTCVNPASTTGLLRPGPARVLAGNRGVLDPARDLLRRGASLVLGSWVGVWRPLHLSLLLTAPRMVLPKILVLDAPCILMAAGVRPLGSIHGWSSRPPPPAPSLLALQGIALSPF